MNYSLATAYCFECGRCRPVAEMDFVSANKKRKACADCRERIEREREKAKKRAKGAKS